jgi:hypothetical protein
MHFGNVAKADIAATDIYRGELQQYVCSVQSDKSENSKRLRNNLKK